MNSLFYGLMAVVLIVATLAGIARHDFWKRKGEYMGTVQSKNKYKRTVRKINILLASSIIILIALNYVKPDSEVEQPEQKAESQKATVSNEVEADEGKEVTVDTNLVMGGIAKLPDLPSEYQDRYDEVNEVITRTDAFLDLIKKNLSECEGSCEERPLTEIQDRFDAMDELFTIVRNQLQKASEIVSEMAFEDPAELHTQKLFELEENLQATTYSLETMQIADSWESWDEPIEYVESTRTKRLYAVPLKDTILPKNEESIENQDDDNIVYEDSNIAAGEHFTEQQLNEVSISNEITVDRAIDMTYEMIGMIYVCGKICDDYPISDIEINLSYVKEDVLNSIASIETMSEVMRQLENSNTPNVDQDAVKKIADQLEISKERMTTLLTKNDWPDWKAPGVYGTESIAYLENLKNNLAF